MSSGYSIEALSLQGVYLIHRVKHEDDRGSFSRLFCSDALVDAGWTDCIQQVNYSHSKLKGTIRGMHCQKTPHSEMKLVSCIRGEVYDVVVDLRVNSPTFLQWHGVYLSAENSKSLLIPEGVAHGFQTQEDYSELIYAHSKKYEPTHEAGVNPFDPAINITWPQPVSCISARDSSVSFLDLKSGDQFL